jgi:predicted nicotinamide N-methyase
VLEDLVLQPVPSVPGVVLHQARDHVGLWDSSGGAYHSDTPPPYWAFPWAGGQALARYVIEHPDVVAGQNVLDLGTGSGLVAIAAAKAGASLVLACDTDPDAIDAAALNAAANGVEITGVVGDALVGNAHGCRVILVGDMFYGPSMVNRVMRFLRRSGARCLVGDPGRGFLLPDRFDELAVYDIPVRSVVEDVSTMRTTIWQLQERQAA